MMAIATKANCQSGDRLGAEGQEESPVYTLPFTNNTDQPLENLTPCVSGPARVGFGGGVASPPGRRLLGSLRKKTAPYG